MKRIAMILLTDGFEYDDRIRKEILTIKSQRTDVEFEIFAIIDGKHALNDSGLTDYGIKYTLPLLKSRLKYKSGSHLLKKAWEFYSVVNPKLKDFDAIWCANFDPFMFILLSRKPKVWDMHELPEMFLSSGLKKIFLKILMQRCKVIIHANVERLHYLKKINALAHEANQYVIRNFPMLKEASINIDSKYKAFIAWLGDNDCVYLQGIYNNSRCDIESIEAIMLVPQLKAVVVGNFNSKLKEQLEKKYGDKLQEKVFFTGMLPQKTTSIYIKKCKVALILYRNTNPNNYYCEPNRMYQAIINNCPVVVGCNPPMKELVTKFGFGVVLDDDGSSTIEIVKGLNKIFANYLYYHDCIIKNKNVVLWEQQDSVFHEIIESLF